jgi:ABC-2 type transport system permease protein
MNKILLIAKREYTTRVKNKTFLLSTFLLPIVFVGFIAGSTYLGMKTKEYQKVIIQDPNNYFDGYIKNTKEITFDFAKGIDTTNYASKGYTAIVVIPKWDGQSKLDYIIRSPKQIGINAKNVVEDKIDNAIGDKILQQHGVNPNSLDSLRKTSPATESHEQGDNGSNFKTTSSELSMVIGFASGILIYMMMFIYGAQVMRGVMEEKTNRIAEVIVSSVKPMQLMLGKIFGIGAVGLTQFLLWIILIIGLTTLAQYVVPHEWLQNAQQMQQNNPMSPGMNNMVQASAEAPKAFKLFYSLQNAPWLLIIPCFLFYFLGGFLFYAALFASVGCMVNEDPQDAQSLMLPITMPIIFGFIIMQQAIQHPDSTLAVWGSMVPFTSPIVMVARIASHPPAWQIILSMLLLIGGFLFTGWMAGKIYRTGILMYGKKGTWKEMMKWVFAK